MNVSMGWARPGEAAAPPPRTIADHEYPLTTRGSSVGTVAGRAHVVARQEARGPLAIGPDRGPATSRPRASLPAAPTRFERGARPRPMALDVHGDGSPRYSGSVGSNSRAAHRGQYRRTSSCPSSSISHRNARQPRSSAAGRSHSTQLEAISRNRESAKARSTTLLLELSPAIRLVRKCGLR